MINKKVEVGKFASYVNYKGIVEGPAILIKEINYVFPLYFYSTEGSQQIIQKIIEKISNLTAEISNQAAEKFGLIFVLKKEPPGNVCFINNPEVRPAFKTTFTLVDILDYIYASIHSTSCLKKNKEFLKIDFSRISNPNDVETFWRLAELGSELRQIHLLKSPGVNQFITSYQEDGENTITREMTTKSIGWEPVNSENTVGRVWINDTRYFDNVPFVAWDLYIGDYQPAREWLKDRYGSTLTVEEILHYQKIIVALSETVRLIKEVDKIGVE
ncbi:MAG: hypothetical protein GX126_04725 [Bacteroidales bacterium]|nr:hypothetical protein [Bacteroidales bacterium]